MRASTRQFLLNKVSAGTHDDAHRKALNETGFWGTQGAGCLFFARSTGRFLVNHRSASVEQPNTWGTWGGAIDPNEDPEDAVLREAREEAGFKGKADATLVYEFVKGTFRYSNFILIINEEFTPRLDWESQGYKWCEFGKWPQPLHFGLKALLDNSKAVALMKSMVSTARKETNAAKADPNIGRTWTGREGGVRKVENVYNMKDGRQMYGVSTDGGNHQDLFPIADLEKEIALETRIYEANKRSREAAKIDATKRASAEELRTSLDGFEKTLTHMQRGRAIQSLIETGMRVNGRTYNSRRDAIRAVLKDYDLGMRKGSPVFFSKKDPEVFLEGKPFTSFGMAYAHYLNAKKIGVTAAAKHDQKAKDAKYAGKLRLTDDEYADWKGIPNNFFATINGKDPISTRITMGAKTAEQAAKAARRECDFGEVIEVFDKAKDRKTYWKAVGSKGFENVWRLTPTEVREYQKGSPTTASLPMYYHGSPYTGLRPDLSNWASRQTHGIYLSPDVKVAHQYAMNPISGAGYGPQGAARQPTIYEMRLHGNPKLFDTRDKTHRVMYSSLRDAAVKHPDFDAAHTTLPKEYNKIAGRYGLIPYNASSYLTDPLKQAGFDGMWVDDGTHGATLRIFEPKRFVRIEKSRIAHSAAVQKRVMPDTYEEALFLANQIEAELQAAKEEWRKVPGYGERGPMGLVAEHVRLSPAYRKAKAAWDAANAHSRAFHTVFQKKFKNEIKRDHNARRQAQLDRLKTESSAADATALIKEAWENAIPRHGAFVLKKWYPIIVKYNGVTRRFAAHKANGSGPLRLTMLVNAKRGPEFHILKLDDKKNTIEFEGTKNLWALTEEARSEQVAQFENLFKNSTTAAIETLAAPPRHDAIEDSVRAILRRVGLTSRYRNTVEIHRVKTGNIIHITTGVRVLTYKKLLRIKAFLMQHFKATNFAMSPKVINSRPFLQFSMLVRQVKKPKATPAAKRAGKLQTQAAVNRVVHHTNATLNAALNERR